MSVKTAKTMKYITKNIWINKIQGSCPKFGDLYKLADKQLMVMSANLSLVSGIYEQLIKYKSMKEAEVVKLLDDMKFSVLNDAYKFSETKTVFVQQYNSVSPTFNLLYNCFGDFKNIKHNIKYRTGRVYVEVQLVSEQFKSRSGLDMSVKITATVDDLHNFSATQENVYVRSLFDSVYQAMMDEDKTLELTIEYKEVRCFSKFMVIFKSMKALEREFIADGVRYKKVLTLNNDTLRVANQKV